jgi:hypothetical protein
METIRTANRIQMMESKLIDLERTLSQTKHDKKREKIRKKMKQIEEKIEKDRDHFDKIQKKILSVTLW